MNKPSKAIAALCLLSSANSYALGVGEIKTHSALNQILRAQIPLLSSKNEDPSNVRIGIASREVFKKAGIDRPHYLTEIKFTPTLSKNGDITIDVRSNSTIKEPFVNFILEIEWPQGRTLKEFTILLDPPVTLSDIAPSAVQLAKSSTKVSANTATTKHLASTAVTSDIAQQYGPTKSSDTVWKIAKKLSPKGSTFSHQQMMLALYDNNPKAFYKKNINALKKGAILKTPTQQQIQSRTLSQAQTAFNQQHTQWTSITTANKTAIAKSTQPAAVADSDKKKLKQNAEPAKLTLLTASKQSSVDVTVEGNTVDTPVGSNNPNVQANIAIEMATTLEAENKDVKSRLNDLESQLEKLQRLIALKDEQLAQLQSVKPAVTKPAPAKPIIKEPASIDTDDNLPLYAGGGLLVALLGLVLARRRKKNDKPKTENPFSSPASSDEPLHPAAEEQEPVAIDNSSTLITEEPLLSEFTPSEFDTSTQTQEADPMTECDVYIAYGRYQQAQDLIEVALTTDPDNLNYKLKLLDVHFAAGNSDAFEQLAQELSNLQQSDQQAWNNIIEMGADLCPNAELFKSNGTQTDNRQTATTNEPVSNTGDDSEELDFYAQHDDSLEPEQSNTEQANDHGNEIEFTAAPEDEDSSIDSVTEDDSKHDDKGDEFEFDFDLIKNEVPNEQAEPTDDIELDSVFAEENNEDTKLSLAQAYIEMEDLDSARDSLNEVLQSGNSLQQQRAQDMLDKL